MLRFSGAGVSEVGLRRDHNEDSGFVGPYVALVADGVGGAAAGEVASATATHALTATALSRFGDDAEAVLRAGVAAARPACPAGAEDDPARAGMATTLTAVASDGRRVMLGHLGDSRAYTVRERAVRPGLPGPHRGPGPGGPGTAHAPPRCATTRGATWCCARSGPTRAWRSTTWSSPSSTLGPGDRILLCSDGLTDLVPEARIEAVLRLRDPHSAAAVLTHAALEAGGIDNVTCVVARRRRRAARGGRRPAARSGPRRGQPWTRGFVRQRG